MISELIEEFARIRDAIIISRKGLRWCLSILLPSRGGYYLRFSEPHPSPRKFRNSSGNLAQIGLQLGEDSRTPRGRIFEKRRSETDLLFFHPRDSSSVRGSFTGREEGEGGVA